MVNPLPSAVPALNTGNEVLRQLDRMAAELPRHEDPASEQTLEKQVENVVADLQRAIAANKQEEVVKIAYHGHHVVPTARKANEYGLQEAQKDYQRALDASKINKTPETAAAVVAAAAEVKEWSDSLVGLNDYQLEVDEKIDQIVASANTPDTTSVDTAALTPIVPVAQPGVPAEKKLETQKMSGRSTKLMEYITTLKQTMAAYEDRLKELKLQKKTAADDFSNALTQEKIQEIKAGVNIAE